MTETRPRDAYELCARAADLIEANPLHYFQDWFFCARDDGREFPPGLPPELDVPENTCGTAFCRAGWIIAAYGGFDAVITGYRSIEREAYRLLGTSVLDDETEFGDDICDLFSGGALVDSNGGRLFTPGTPEYAKAGADGIRAFMAKHEARLRATSLEGL